MGHYETIRNCGRQVRGKQTLATIGYEAATVPDFLHALTDEGVQILVDVPAMARPQHDASDRAALPGRPWLTWRTWCLGSPLVADDF